MRECDFEQQLVAAHGLFDDGLPFFRFGKVSCRWNFCAADDLGRIDQTVAFLDGVELLVLRSEGGDRFED